VADPKEVEDVSTILLALLAMTVVNVEIPLHFSSEQIQTWHFVPVVTFGDDEDEILGKNVASVINDNGRYYLLDTQARKIIVIETEGVFDYHNFEGEGPGETWGASDLVKLTDRYLGLLFPLAPKLIITELQLHENLPSPMPFEILGVARNLEWNGNVFALHTKDLVEDELYFYLAVFEKNGARRADVYRDQCESCFPLWWIDQGRYALADSSIYMVPNEEYLIQEFSLSGVLLRTIEQPDYPHRDLLYAEDEYYSSARLSLGHSPDVHSLHYVNDQLLVLTSATTVADTLSFDSYHDGDTGKVIVQGPIPSPTARYFWLDDDHLAIVYGAMQASTESTDRHEVVIFERTDP